MAIDESSRHALFSRLKEVLGKDEASTLMEHLPPVGWADVATKSDLESLRIATKADIESLRVATKADIESLRLNLDVLENKLVATFRAELNTQARTMVNWLIFATSASTLTVAVLAFGAARLI
jgi:hypothetical protein